MSRSVGGLTLFQTYSRPDGPVRVMDCDAMMF
jgi:hypothetical protein